MRAVPIPCPYLREFLIIANPMSVEMVIQDNFDLHFSSHS